MESKHPDTESNGSSMYGYLQYLMEPEALAVLCQQIRSNEDYHHHKEACETGRYLGGYGCHSSTLQKNTQVSPFFGLLKDFADEFNIKSAIVIIHENEFKGDIIECYCQSELSLVSRRFSLYRAKGISQET